MIHSNTEIGSGSPPHAAEVEPPAAVVHAGGSADTPNAARAREVLAVRLEAVGSDWDARTLRIASEGDTLPIDWEDAIAAMLAFAKEATPQSDGTATGGRCPAAPDHADIMETIENAADDWHKQGYTSALDEVRDMANVGRALMEALPQGYSYMNSPSEIVSDLQNDLADALATAPEVAREAGHLAAWHAIYGPNGDPFQNPEGFDFASKVADAVIAALFVQSSAGSVDIAHAEVAPISKVAIWSGEHRAYWRRGSRGEGAHYTLNVDEAGIWSREDATRLTSHCGPDKLIALHDRPSQSKEHTP